MTIEDPRRPARVSEERPAPGPWPTGQPDQALPGPLPLHPVTPAEAVAEAELPQAPEDLPLPPAAEGAKWRAVVVPHLAISLGGLIGANARFLVGSWATDRWGSDFPWGTLLINLTGSFLIGFYLTLITERFTGRAATRLFFATGFLGAYTTFSTFSFEAITLLLHGSVLAAVAYAGASLMPGLVAVLAGILVAHVL